jgi:hypothetical protein
MDRRRSVIPGKAAALVCVALTLLLATGWHRVLRPAPGILEAALILAAFLALRGHPAVMQAWRSASAGYRAFAWVVLAALFAGHLADYNAFPLVEWGMYSRVHDEDSPVYQEYIATLASGEEREFHPASLFPALRNAHIMRNLQLHVKALRNEEDPRRRRTYNDTLAALVRIHNRRNPVDAIVALRAFSATLPIHPYRGQEAVQRTFLWEIDLGSPEAG